MKIISTLFDLKNLNNILKRSSGVIIGNEAFGTRLTNSFNQEDIKKILNITTQEKKDFYLLANQMMTDDQLELFKVFLQSFDVKRMTGVIVADIGAVMVLKELKMSHQVIYHPETLHTNAFDFNFLSDQGILGACVAKEITLDDIKSIALEKKHQLWMIGHGHLNMFYSKRHLLKTFSTFAHLDHQELHQNQTLKIIEEHRKDAPYPILEDVAGTHVFRHEVFASLHYLNQLKPIVDVLVIDSMFKDDQYAIEVLDLYAHLKPHQDHIEDLKKRYQETWDDGFLHKKTIYKKV